MRWLVLLLSAGCATAPPANWHYGESWGGECARGHEQSPIDLRPDAAHLSLSKVQFEYWPSSLHVLNNGHTLELDYDPGSSLIVDGEHYVLEQMRFHQPSEHTLDGKPWAMELQLVHRGKRGIAVVAVPIVEGAANRWLQPAWTDFPIPGERHDLDAKINAADLVPATKTLLHYAGSLTTPPCSEKVSWFLVTTPIEMSKEQITAFAQKFGDNHRPTQPLGGRVVEKVEIR